LRHGAGCVRRGGAVQDRITVLIVDDSVNLCESLKLNLAHKHGFAVHTAQDGKTGLHLARTLRPDIIILDVMMPDMSGGQVAELLHELPATARIPIIFLTGILSQDEVEERGGEIGGEKFMAKPVSHQELAAAIHTQLGR